MSEMDHSYRLKEAPIEDSFAIGNGYLRLIRAGSKDASYWAGEFVAPGHMVSIYRQHNHTRLDLVVGKRCEVRSWNRYLGDRTVARLARAFIADYFPAAIRAPGGES